MANEALRRMLAAAQRDDDIHIRLTRDENKNTQGHFDHVSVSNAHSRRFDWVDVAIRWLGGEVEGWSIPRDVVLAHPCNRNGSVNIRFTEPAAQAWKRQSKRLF